MCRKQPVTIKVEATIQRSAVMYSIWCMQIPRGDIMRRQTWTRKLDYPPAGLPGRVFELRINDRRRESVVRARVARETAVRESVVRGRGMSITLFSNCHCTKKRNSCCCYDSLRRIFKGVFLIDRQLAPTDRQLDWQLDRQSGFQLDRQFDH